ncbi:MAG: cytochrome c class [Acidobacteriaceae bacterium]|nr:cytochrome c class [Acidobacteriaceae bacterium]
MFLGQFQALSIYNRNILEIIIRRRSISLLAIALLLFGSIVFCESQTQSHSSHPKSKVDPAKGQQVFVSICAGCHGLDGRGAERAPNIAANPKVQQLSDTQLSAVIANGVHGTAMPPFRSLGTASINSVVAYLRTLQDSGAAAVLPGDPAKGKSIFFGKAGCSSCHMAEGAGGFLGADLSGYAGNHSIEELRGAIADPVNNTDWRRSDLVAVTQDGQSVSGIARNQDNFSVQLQTADGQFHFFERSQLRSLEHQAKPVMPSDYASTLSREEIDHLISYLMNIGASKKRERRHEDDE